MRRGRPGDTGDHAGDTPDVPRDQPPEPGGKPSRRTLADGRQQVLLYLPPAMIKALKLAAVEGDSSVSQIVETLVAAWLARPRPPADPGNADVGASDRGV